MPKNPAVTRLDDVAPRQELSLDDIQNEEWLIRTLEKVSSNKFMDVSAELLDELNSIMSECTESYHNNSPNLPVIKEREDMILLSEKESRFTALLSRIAEIKISLIRIRMKIDEYWEMCEDRISRYPCVSKELTNDRKRTLFYRSCLRPLRDKQQKLEMAVETSAIIEGYLNTLHFSVKEISALGRDYLAKSTRVDYDQMR